MLTIVRTPDGVSWFVPTSVAFFGQNGLHLNVEKLKDSKNRGHFIVNIIVTCIILIQLFNAQQEGEVCTPSHTPVTETGNGYL